MCFQCLFFQRYKCLLDIVVAAEGMVISVVVFSVLAVVLISIVVGSVVAVVVLVVVKMVGSTLEGTVVDSGPEFTSLLIVIRTNTNMPIQISCA